MFKSKVLTKYLQPDEFNAKSLREKYPQPKALIDEIFGPFREADKKKVPTLHYQRILNGHIWKASLQFQWPAVITVSGRHLSQDQAEENAYLVACQLFMHLGFIRLHKKANHWNAVAMKPEDLMAFVENLSKLTSYVAINHRTEINVHVVSSEIDSGASWQASVSISSPFSFEKSCTAPTLQLAYYQACLMALMRFKRLDVLDYCNSPIPQRFMHLEYPQLDSFIPDHEIYTDASRLGIGAYLRTRDDDTVRWLSDSWSDRIPFDPAVDTNMSELYALVTACFTWKHKLCNQKVLCYTDNITVVDIVNKGMYAFKNTKVGYERLFYLLSNTCKGRNITLVAAYIQRDNNSAADYLSRSDVLQFKHAVPNAHPNPKKSKKLYFLKRESFQDVHAC